MFHLKTYQGLVSLLETSHCLGSIFRLFYFLYDTTSLGLLFSLDIFVFGATTFKELFLVGVAVPNLVSTVAFLFNYGRKKELSFVCS